MVRKNNKAPILDNINGVLYEFIFEQKVKVGDKLIQATFSAVNAFVGTIKSDTF